MEFEDFHNTLEPVVIIKDEEDTEEEDFFSKLELYRKGSNFKYHNLEDSDPNKRILHKLLQKADISNEHLMIDNSEEGRLLRKISSEISIIPVMPSKKKQHYKIRLINRDYSEKSSESSRNKVRVVSPQEASQAAETYQRRRSSPLQKCPICKKFFRRMQTHLQKHEMMVKTVMNPPVCPVCGKMFSSELSLQAHTKIHTTDRQYVCDVCNKQFTQSCNLVNHMRIHTGERPFKCPHCDKAFTQSGNLNNHIRLHTDEKPFKCHFCDRAFVQSGNLSSHIKNNHRADMNVASDPRFPPNFYLKKEKVK